MNLNQINPYNSACASGRIPSLDGFRGVAVLMVIFGHGSYSLSFPGWLLPFINSGLGVKVFFVLSGYLIYSLSFKELLGSGRFNWKQFYLRRILRIFPCFFFYIFVVMILSGLGLYVISWPMLTSAATFTLNYRQIWDRGSIDPNDYHIIGHYWTLALEEQFYTFWPLLVGLIQKGNLQVVLIIAIAIAPLIRIVSYIMMPETRGYLCMMAHSGYDAIAVGVLLGDLMARSRSRLLLETWAYRSFLNWFALIILFVISPAMESKFRGAYGVTYGATIDLISIAWLIVSGVSNKTTYFFRFLNWTPLMKIGGLSYSIYVWNNLFLYSHSRLPLNYAPWNFIFVMLAALFSYFVIEKPFLRFKEHIGSHKRAFL